MEEKTGERKQPEAQKTASAPNAVVPAHSVQKPQEAQGTTPAPTTTTPAQPVQKPQEKPNETLATAQTTTSQPTIPPSQPPVAAKPVGKPRITYDDFAKLDLRVAKILDAEPVAGSDKLLKLKIKVGTEERQLVAGIAQHYAPDEILGKKIIIIANLEPRKIRGLESNGMLLAAAQEEDGKLVKLCLATVDDPEFPDGSTLS